MCLYVYLFMYLCACVCVGGKVASKTNCTDRKRYIIAYPIQVRRYYECNFLLFKTTPICMCRYHYPVLIIHSRTVCTKNAAAIRNAFIVITLTVLSQRHAIMRETNSMKLVLYSRYCVCSIVDGIEFNFFFFFFHI